MEATQHNVPGWLTALFGMLLPKYGKILAKYEYFM